MPRWKHSIKETMTALEDTLREGLGGRVDGVYRVLTPADVAVAGELDGVLYTDGGTGFVLLISRGTISEDSRETLRSDWATMPVLVIIVARRDPGVDLAGATFDAQRVMAERIDDLEESIDHILDVVAGPYASVARSKFKTEAIKRVGGFGVQATEDYPDLFVHPLEYEFKRLRES